MARHVDNFIFNQCIPVMYELCYYRLRNLQQLHTLDIGNNNLRQLPAVIYELSALRLLDIYSNQRMKTIEKEILHLSNLERLDCGFCTALEQPPYAVCSQGLQAMVKYFADLADAEGVEIPAVPVSLLGEFEAGKTSIKESLKRGRRYLTKREKRSLVDEATKVFQVDNISLQKSVVNLMDFGGHEVYHLAYQYCLRERCIPVIVVNIEQFSSILNSNGPKEAARQVCFNWLSHIYLVSPKLESPILALTHTDKLSADRLVESRKTLLNAVEVIRRELLKEECQCSGEVRNNIRGIVHLSNTDVPIFSPEDIFEFSNDLNVTSNIEELTDNIVRRSSKFNVVLPRLWEIVGKFIEGHADTFCIPVSDIKAKFADDAEIILRYMHNSGRIFWFENVDELSDYIFHRIPEITRMISLLFHHCSEEVWKRRLDSFTSFDHNGRRINRRGFESLVEEFTCTGILDEALLVHLFTEEKTFPFDLAVQILKSFHILHGPVILRTGNAYIIPYFAEDFMDDSWQDDGDLQLRLDIMFGGLSLPRYVFQLMTTVILNHTLGPHDIFHVVKNGATVAHDGNSTHFVHDYNNRKVTLQVSTSLKLLEQSWKHLVETSKNILSLVSKVWTAAHTEVVVYCAHCLFLRHPNPSYEADPNWFLDTHEGQSAEFTNIWTTYDSQNVSCRRCTKNSKILKLTVPKPLRIPCKL